MRFKGPLFTISEFRFQRELIFPANFVSILQKSTFFRNMSLDDQHDFDNYDDEEEEFSDDEDYSRETRNLYNEGLGFAHVRRLEQENELSRANTSERKLKLIGSSGT